MGARSIAQPEGTAGARSCGSGRHSGDARLGFIFRWAIPKQLLCYCARRRNWTAAHGRLRAMLDLAAWPDRRLMWVVTLAIVLAV